MSHGMRTTPPFPSIPEPPLRAKGLVVRKRTVGWTLPEHRPTPAGSSAQNRDGIPF